MTDRQRWETAMAMAIEVQRRLHQRQIDGIALGLEGQTETREQRAAREREQAAFERARDQLADRLLQDVWAPGAAVDIGVWGPSLARAEADTLLRDAVERGMVYLDTSPSPSRWSRLFRVFTTEARRPRRRHGEDQ
jgi:hypothetical protein